MRAYRRFIFPALWLVAALSWSAPGCKGSATATPTPSPTVAGSGNGYTFTNTDFFVNVVPPTGVTVATHIDGSSWTTPCSVAATTTGQDIACIIEIEELDLYDQGLTLQYNASATQCPYVRFMPYMYYQFLPGIGPTLVNMTVTNGAVTAYGDSGDGSPGVVTSASGTTPACNTDYSTGLFPGPNCCEGNYVLDTLTNPAGTHALTVGKWGGKMANCLNGPAVTTQSKDADNRPMADLTFLNGTNLNKQYVIKPSNPIYASNVFAANYFTAPYTMALSPTPIQGPGGAVPNGNPWYELVCLDHSRDVVNRIRVMVRSWSTHSNFAAMVEANSSVNGAETAPFNDQESYDYAVWVGATGFGNAYPGGFN